jgi:GH35 family endo-1,4-beta-xylanase
MIRKIFPAIIILILFQTLCCAELSETEILGQAQSQIEKYRKGDATLRLVGPDGKELESGESIEIKQTKHKFLFGCNIFKLGRCRSDEDNRAYEKHFSELLNFATLPFYWWNYRPEKGNLNDFRTEQIVQWCKENNITTKGHPLAWNWRDPKWLSEEPSQAMQEQFNRIDRCVKKFSGKVDIWDVVNEATYYDRPDCQKYSPKLTKAIKKMGVGEYVRKAFRIARRTNPDATLIINDYVNDDAYNKIVLSELVDEKGQSLYDVIGIQSHMHNGYWGAKKTWNICEKFAKLGKPLHFTELTIVSGPRTDKGWLSTPEGEARQATQVAELYPVLFSHPAVEAITWWDFTDQNAWQRAPAGLLRKDMTPKPAYNELKRLIKEEWSTHLTLTTDKNGQVQFRGFFGTYKVTATVGSQKLNGSFSLDKNTTQPVTVKLQ